jgi:large subunit ribosomal protein L4
VHGANKKPWPQKGFGRARHGSKKSPQWRGGGATKGPVPHSHAISLPMRIRAHGLRIALTAKYQEGRLFVIDSAKWRNTNTAELEAYLRVNGLTGGEMTQLVYGDGEGGEGLDGNLAIACRTLPYFDIIPQIGLTVWTILRHRNLIISKAALLQLQKRLDPFKRQKQMIKYCVGSAGGGINYDEYKLKFRAQREQRLLSERTTAMTKLYRDPPVHLIEVLKALPKSFSAIGDGEEPPQLPKKVVIEQPPTP